MGCMVPEKDTPESIFAMYKIKNPREKYNHLVTAHDEHPSQGGIPVKEASDMDPDWTC